MGKPVLFEAKASHLSQRMEERKTLGAYCFGLHQCIGSHSELDSNEV